MADHQVQVIEGGAAVLILRRQVGKQPVGVGGPSSQDEGGLIFYERDFDIQPAGQQYDHSRAGDLLFVPFAAVDIKSRGKTTAEFGRDAALIQLHVFYHFRIEDGEQTEEVG